MCRKQKKPSETLAPPNPTYEDIERVPRLEMDMRVAEAVQNERCSNIKWGTSALLALVAIFVVVAMWLWPPG